MRPENRKVVPAHVHVCESGVVAVVEKPVGSRVSGEGHAEESQDCCYEKRDSGQFSVDSYSIGSQDSVGS